MIVITGAAGFIGSCLVAQLNEAGYKELLLVDDFSGPAKQKNYTQKQFLNTIDRNQFLQDLQVDKYPIRFIFHLGARTDTTEQSTAIFDQLNVNYSQQIWAYCCRKQIPLVYASSAATYGLGELGYEDNHQVVEQLQPLNPYGVSKNDFDKWVLKQPEQPPFWTGLKFFNVYGPNEYHKGRMASVVFHTVRQIKATGQMKLFRSHRPDIADGQQSRDFIYVKDVVKVCLYLFNQSVPNGLYNLGTGTARPFWDLATNTFRAMGLEPKITFIDTPKDIRDTYQYFTEANMQKLIAAGYTDRFYTLEEGIEDYVKHYLLQENIW